MVKSSAALLLLVLVACDPKIPTRPPIRPIVPSEPQHIVVHHILISFGGKVPKAARTQEEAGKLAREILEKAKAGEDFPGLIKAHTDDSFPGRYKLANKNVEAGKGETAYGGLVPGFTETAFSLKVREIGMAVYEEKNSPFGWHIIQRIE